MRWYDAPPNGRRKAIIWIGIFAVLALMWFSYLQISLTPGMEVYRSLHLREQAYEGLRQVASLRVEQDSEFWREHPSRCCLFRNEDGACGVMFLEHGPAGLPPWTMLRFSTMAPQEKPVACVWDFGSGYAYGPVRDLDPGYVYGLVRDPRIVKVTLYYDAVSQENGADAQESSGAESPSRAVSTEELYDGVFFLWAGGRYRETPRAISGWDAEGNLIYTEQLR